MKSPSTAGERAARPRPPPRRGPPTAFCAGAGLDTGTLSSQCPTELPRRAAAADQRLEGRHERRRPASLVPDEDLHVEGSHPRRLHLTPGMTGMWQVSGSSRIPLQDMVKIDYLYGANWSLWLD